MAHLPDPQSADGVGPARLGAGGTAEAVQHEVQVGARETERVRRRGGRAHQHPGRDFRQDAGRHDLGAQRRETGNQALSCLRPGCESVVVKAAKTENQ